MFRFRSTSAEEFDAYYTRLSELLESETHPFRPEFHRAMLAASDIRNALRSFLGKRAQR